MKFHLRTNIGIATHTRIAATDTMNRKLKLVNVELWFSEAIGADVPRRIRDVLDDIFRTDDVAYTGQ